MSDDNEREIRRNDIRKLLYQAAGIIPSTPPLEMNGHAATLKAAVLAVAREKKPADAENMSDDEMWDRVRGEPVTLEMLLAFMGGLVDAVDAIEKRVIVLENPKQPWESERP